ncbi:MAG: glycosyltransferase family 2 protein, partial [Boseongicola sp.]|nr:glycosyltransferase family 2 protein [Boseongicola sp.]
MDHQIAMLWMRGRLSYLELLCVQSFLDIGHEVVFYSYDPVENVPDGVELRDANEICPEEGFLVHAGTGSPALHSDFFRYRLLKQHPGIIWADTDAYCMRRFRTWDGHLHGWEGERDINGGVLALPEDSATLARLIEHTSDAYSVPLWMERYAGGRGRPLREAIATGGKVHAGEQPWGVWGPHAVTYFLHETGDVKFTRGHRVLYPYPYEKRRKMLDPNHIKRERFVTDETLSIHLYGRRMRRALVTKHEGVPHPESVLGQLLLKHRINPLLAPLKDSPPLNPDGEKERVFREVAEGRKSYTTAKVEDGEPVPTVRPLDRVVAVTTMRNEGPFILDWIAYHLAIGVTHFLVYTNDCDDPTVEILDALSERGLVTRIDNPAVSGERPQRVALAHAMGQRVVSNADAVIVFDVDEYINIHVGDGTLETLFNACGDPDMISMTWRLFGTSGHVAYEDEPMPLRFTRGAQHHLRRPHQAWGFKTIQRKGAPFARLGVHRPHEPVGSMPHWTNGSGKQMPDSYLEEGWRSSKNSWGYDLVTLNHYATRSVESFLVKRDRGRTNHIAREQGVDYWQAFNRNDEEDTSISKRWEAAGTIRDEFTNDPVLGPLHKLSVAWHKARIEQLKTNPREQTLFDHLSNEPLRFDIEDVVLPKASPIEKTKLRKVSRSALRSQREDDPPATGVEADTAFKNLMARIQPKQRMLTPLAAPPPAERIVIISSMKNEGCFILEWIAFFFFIVLSNFVIYT